MGVWDVLRVLVGRNFVSHLLMLELRKSLKPFKNRETLKRLKT